MANRQRHVLRQAFVASFAAIHSTHLTTKSVLTARQRRHPDVVREFCPDEPLRSMAALQCHGCCAIYVLVNTHTALGQVIIALRCNCVILRQRRVFPRLCVEDSWVVIVRAVSQLNVFVG